MALGQALRALVIAALMLAAPVHAMLPVPAEKEAAPAEAGQAIETGSSEAEDGQIARRIEGIFAALDGFGNVSVAVRQGVVELEGKVAEPGDIARAEQIASRIKGVVTVENRIVRDLSVGDSIESVGGLRTMAEGLVEMLPLIGIALLAGALIAAFGYLLASLTGIWQRLAPNSFLAELIASAIRFVFVIGGIVAALNILGATALLGAVLGGAGIIGIALGFAMRDTVENYVASLMLSLRQPFRANDHVVIDEFEGRVIRLTSRATVLMTLDGNHLRIPNGNVFKAVILNYTRNPQRRLEFDLGVDAEDDPTAARHLGEQVLRGLDFVLDDPPPAARIEQVGDSNIVIRFLAWIDQRETDWFKARSRAIPAVKNALEQAGFALPEPIYRLRFDSGSPLPFQNLSEAQADGAKPPTRPAPAAEAIPEDVSPRDEIAQMVARERRVEDDTGSDLLDSGRPVE